MKPVIIISILLTLILPSFAKAQLTKEDVRQIVKEENAKLEKSLREYVDLNLKAVRSEIDSVRSEVKSLRSETITLIEAVRAEIASVKWMLSILIVVIVAVLALPQAISFIRERKENRELVDLREEVAQLAKLQERVAQLEQQLQIASANPQREA